MKRLAEGRGLHKIFYRNNDFLARTLDKLGIPVGIEKVHALNDAGFELYKGEVLGLAGESGCGKSTLGRIIAGINRPTAGQMIYKGKSIQQMDKAEKKRFGCQVQMIFQDPFSSLNPRMRIGSIISQAPLKMGIWKAHEKTDRLEALLRSTGLDMSCVDRYPHQFSGGQRQRIGIARALAVNPECIVCDESVAALDVSIQAQIINLFMALKQQYQLSYLFISHDLGVVRHICDRVMIMYLGKIVESASTRDLFDNPCHPYTEVLLQAVPRLKNRHHQYAPIHGEPPSPINPPTGCHFHPRCKKALTKCATLAPELREITPGHFASCHLF